MTDESQSDKKILKRFIIFWLTIFIILPTVFTLLLYADILPKNSSVIFTGKTITETYNNFFTLLPEIGFIIYLVLIAFSGYFLGSASQRGLTVFWSVIVVLIMFIPTAWDLRYVDEGIGFISVLSILIPTGFCSVAGFFGYVLHKEGEIYDGANNNKSL